MFDKVYIVCPTKTATGGTELLHQLSEKLLELKINAQMFYIGTYENSNVQSRFEKYKKNISYEIEDNSNNLIIVPETQIRHLFKYKNIQKAVWWLSVDFYPGSFKMKSDLIHTIVRRIRDCKVKLYDKKWIHFVQSEYARLYLIEEREIDEKNIFPLSDYISDTFFDGINLKGIERKNICLYNPKKGYKFTKKIINYCNEVQWIPLINMTPIQMKKTMLSSKLYIDFGNHPGKDRIPREAALCGCCIITGKRGSAKNSIDVMIPDNYKFEDKLKNIKSIKEKIYEIMKDYDNDTHDFEEYRKKIENEEKEFCKDVKKFFTRGE